MNWYDNIIKKIYNLYKGEEMQKHNVGSYVRVSQDCIDMINHFEGWENEAYWDKFGQVWTIGVGFTKGVKKGDYLTDEQIEKRLHEELKDYTSGVKRSVKTPITQGMFDACVSFSFNLGNGAFASSTLLEKLNDGDYKGASNEFPKWVYAGGKKLLGLQRRRDAERLMFLSKDWHDYRRDW